jgi:hypothetical protein
VAVTLGAAACTGSTATGTTAPTAVAQATTAAPTPAPTPAPTATATPAPSTGGMASNASTAPSGVPTSIDPCQLVTSQEAGALAGASFGPGKETTLSGNGRMCTYGYQTKNVFEVIAAVAPDEATAKQQEAQAEAELKANAAKLNQGLNITQLPAFAPNTDAVLLELKPNTIGVAGRAIYVLHGTEFFGFSDLVLGGAAPSVDAMKAQAMTAISRLP